MNAGQDDTIGLEDFSGIGANQYAGILGDLFQGLGHGVKIAHAVIDDCNSIHNVTYIRYIEAYRLPLVDGVIPAMRGSASSAMRRARPKALKMVSAM